MYNLPYFKEKEGAVVLEFIKAHPFATLIGCQGSLPVATQVPLLIEEREGALVLQGHIMKGTDHHKAFLQNKEALCLFTGAHTYVSASLYTVPQTASTWNYMSVHVRGKLHFLGEEELLLILEKTTTLFENNPASPAGFKQLPQEYVDKLIPAITAFELTAEKIDNVFKLSQNRDEASYNNIIQHLSEGDGDAQTIAAEMKARTESLFSKQS